MTRPSKDVAQASPTKQFLVSMLTRDISLKLGFALQGPKIGEDPSMSLADPTGLTRISCASNCSDMWLNA